MEYLKYFSQSYVTEKNLNEYFKNNKADKQRLDYLISRVESEKTYDGNDINRMLQFAKKLQKETEEAISDFSKKYPDFEDKGEALSIATQQYENAYKYISKASSNYQKLSGENFEKELKVLCRKIELDLKHQADKK